jgi:hypothetical protein
MKVLLTSFPQLFILYIESFVSLLELFPIITMLRVVRVLSLNKWSYKGQKFFKLKSLFF